jgi:hypothetical protein
VADTKPTAAQVAHHLGEIIQNDAKDLRQRIEHNKHGYTADELYAAMGQPAAAAVADYFAKAAVAVSALTT